VKYKQSFTSRAPLSLRVNKSARAPKTINVIVRAVAAPLILDAKIHLKGVSQTKTARINVIRNANGIAFVAGQRNPTIRTKIAAIGMTESRARIPSDILLVLSI